MVSDSNLARYLPVGDKALSIEFSQKICQEDSLKVLNLDKTLKERPIIGIESTLPTYRSLLIYYNPLEISVEDLQKQLQQLELSLIKTEIIPFRLISIPTIYGGRYGPDLEFVAQHNNLSIEKAIELHCSVEYQVSMMGFTPGFPYLSGMSPEISTPRLPNPRLKVSAGSVGIAGSQTGIYPQDSPGGWRIIGWTPLKLYDPDRVNPILLEIGDRIRFLPVKEEEGDILVKGVETELNLRKRVKEKEKFLKASRKMGTFSVIKGGIFTTVQDKGRYGYSRYGVPFSGAMDCYSMALANCLVGNELKEAVLEITLMGEEAEFMFHNPARVAVVGGRLTFKINGQDVPQDRGVPIKSQDIISFSAFEKGFRAYLAVSGGVEVPAVLDSRSTYAGGNLGGFQGRILEKGDVISFDIPINTADYTTSLLPSFDKSISLPNPSTTLPIKIRVVIGPQDDHFTIQGLDAFLSSEYEITVESDRRGLRLAGPPVERKDVGEIVSDGTPPGSIQIIGSGLPLIIMKDGPTTGGYPKIASVITPDLDLLAQVKPGDRIRFEKISIEKSHQIYREYEKKFEQLTKELPIVITLKEEDLERIITMMKEKSARIKKYIFNIVDEEYTIEVEIL